MKITVPIPSGGENNLESLFLKAQSGDSKDVKAYEEALRKKIRDEHVCKPSCHNPCLLDD